MGKLPIFILILLILPFISAVNVQVEKISQDEVMIFDLNKPAVFDLKIYNNGVADKIQFYNLFGFDMFPKEPIEIKPGERKEIELKVYPRDVSNYRGFYTLQYFIKGNDEPDQEERVTFEIIDLKDSFEIGSGDVNPESNSIQIFIKNKKNFNFGEINTKFSSPFFKTEETFSLAPYEKKEFNIGIKKEDFSKLVAGFYNLNAEINVENLKTNINGVINFIEKDIVSTIKREYGLIVTTKIIEKKNEGNIIQKSSTQITKNIISRLFTSFSPEPDIIERKGLTVLYTWDKEIKPGETLTIKVKTNWLFPVLIIIFIVVIIVMVKRISKTEVILKKRVNFVKTKGGEFALKVSLTVNAQKYVERVSIVDKLPSVTKIHDRFSGPPPTRVDEKTRRIEWNFEKLEEGETRMVSYIIYSKMGILGKFALPPATAFYEATGKIKEVQSNRAFFVAEQSKEEE